MAPSSSRRSSSTSSKSSSVGHAITGDQQSSASSFYSMSDLTSPTNSWRIQFLDFQRAQSLSTAIYDNTSDKFRENDSINSRSSSSSCSGESNVKTRSEMAEVMTIAIDELSCTVPVHQSIREKMALWRQRGCRNAFSSTDKLATVNDHGIEHDSSSPYLSVEMSDRSSEIADHVSNAHSLDKDPCEISEKRVLIQPFSGCIKQGELLAILGPSGSSKTTLLETLCCKIPQQYIGGRININHMELTAEIARNHFGYVWQHDALHEHLTVEETLDFVCQLRFNCSLDERNRRVNDVIEELGLINCAKTRVGGHSFRGISGGERKRLSIAIELLSNPKVLLLDEPTTGLDSCSALNIIRTLKKLAMNNRIVICTIHQPQSSIYRMFDRIMLLSRGGRAVYFGDGNEAAVAYFERLGFYCEVDVNPSDHFLDIISTFPRKHKKTKKKNTKDNKGSKRKNRADTPIQQTPPTTCSPEYPEFYSEFTCEERVNFLVDAYNSSPLCMENKSQAKSFIEKHNLSKSSSTSSFGRIMTRTNSTTIQLVASSGDTLADTNDTQISLLDNVNSSFNKETLVCEKFCVLFKRHFLEYRRNKTATIFRLLQSAIIGIFIGLVYFQVGTQYDQTSALDRRGVLFFLSLQQAILGSITVIDCFHGWERIVFQREYSSSLYGAFTFYISKLIAELPIQLISPLLFCFVTYFMLGLKASIENFLIYTCCIMITTLCGQAYGMAISTLTPNIDIAHVMCPAVLGVAMLFGGYFVTVDNASPALSWAIRCNFVFYANQIVTFNELSNLNFTCPETSMQIPNSYAPQPTKFQRFMYRITHPFSKQSMEERYLQNVTTSTGPPCIYKTGEEILDSLSFSNVNYYVNFSVLICVTVLAHIIAFIGLRYYVAVKLKK